MYSTSRLTPFDPVSLLKETRGCQIDGCFSVFQEFGQLQLPDNPTGPKTAESEHSSRSCSRNVQYLWLVFQRSGDITVHHILMIEKRLWRYKDSSAGFCFLFEVQKMQEALCKGHCDDASCLSTMSLLIYIGCNWICGHLSPTSLGF